MRESREGAEQERGRQPWAEMYYTRTCGRREFRWDEQDGDRSCRFQVRRTSRDASRAVSTCRGSAGACMSPCGCQDLVLKWAAVRFGHGAGASASHNCSAGREGTHEGRDLLDVFLGADVPDGTRHGKGAQQHQMPSRKDGSWAYCGGQLGVLHEAPP